MLQSPGQVWRNIPAHGHALNARHQPVTRKGNRPGLEPGTCRFESCRADQFNTSVAQVEERSADNRGMQGQFLTLVPLSPPKH